MADRSILFVLPLLLVLRKRKQELQRFASLATLLITRRKSRTEQILLLLRRRQQRRQRQAGRQIWVWPKPKFYFEEIWINRAQNFVFKMHFRVNRNTFESICRLVGPALAKRDTPFRNSVPVHKRVASVLWRLTTNECYRSVGAEFGLGKSTVISITEEFVDAILEHYHEFIRFPQSLRETRQAIEEFEDLDGNFPQAVGAVDGTHVQIIGPKDNRDDFICRTGYPSVILQGIVSAKKKFIDVATGYPGSLHDARVFRCSSISHHIANDDLLQAPTVNISGVDVAPLIIGDGAYPLKRYLMKPFPRTEALDRRQRRFNKELSKKCAVVENAFGLLKGRWRCLRNELNEDVAKAPRTVVACCILHNICVDMDDSCTEDESDGDDSGDDYDLDLHADNARDTILRYLP